MAPALKCDALRTIMSCRLEQFEMLERESKSKFGDRVSEDMFEHLRNRIREFAQLRRLAELHRKSRGDPMDVGEVAPAWSNPLWSPIEQHIPLANVPWESSDFQADALGKRQSQG